MTHKAHILIIDDDAEFRKLLSDLLNKHGFFVIETDDSSTIPTILQQTKINLILLDIMLDGDDGLTICRKLREKSSIPIIMITAMGEAIDRVVGLELGADDYITKPFYPREVVARIKAVLRRENNSLITNDANTFDVKIYFDGWTLLLKQRRLFSPDNVEVSLSAGEYILLEIFLEYPNRSLSRDQLLDYMHHEHVTEIYDRSIDVQVSRLRKRIEINPRNPKLIKTVRGNGYMFCATIEKIAI